MANLAISKLKDWRLLEGLSLEEVSALTGVSVGQLSKVERGLANMAPLTRVQVARRLGVPLRELFDVPALEGDVVRVLEEIVET